MLQTKTNQQTNKQSFVVMVRTSDQLLFQVKDRFVRTTPSINRFLGYVCLDVSTISDKFNETKQ